MNQSILGEVRARCREVAQQAVWVKVAYEAVPAYAAALPRERLLLPEMDPAIHYLGHGDDTVTFCLTLDAINFGSGYFPGVLGERQSGYRTIAAALTDYFRRCGPIPAQRLREISSDECATILGLDASNPAAAELTALYARAWHDLGSLVGDRFDSDFSAILEQAGRSAERLVEILSQMPFYKDVEATQGILVPFYKRAQLTAVDLFIAFGGEGYGSFSDLDRITICADNLVPHVLRHDGVLHYSRDLAQRIDHGEPLEAASAEEVEIRACAVHAGELIVAELQRRGEQVNAMLLDNLLWHRGQEPYYRSRLRHRTKTVFY